MFVTDHHHTFVIAQVFVCCQSYIVYVHLFVCELVSLLSHVCT